ncbi:unnamed protein product [Cylindrotheca closterium]|uniref:Uncharacterized protein n=1 Tax=Cylindrotheca closterium TaxID=2856 RepID=A0AAD2JGD1_9STRA|nr:unnamed protein product [Cylindrotheca closterium]
MLNSVGAGMTALLLRPSRAKGIVEDCGDPGFPIRHSSSLSLKSSQDDFFDPYNLSDSSDDDGKEALSQSLSERIRQLQEKEATQETRLAKRIEGLRQSQGIQDLVDSNKVQATELPVISFDSLLPKQRLEGRTDDPTFCQFLQQVGLGGWFVMVSLDTRTRKIRRHGVLAKLEVMDDGALFVPENDVETSETDAPWIPTAVDFSILGHNRCRIMGPRSALKARIGRWRRGYDPNGEESVLGWGDERFVDTPDELKIGIEPTTRTPSKESSSSDEKTKLRCNEWNSVTIECNLEAVEEETAVEEVEKMQELIPLVDKWYDLASDPKTFENVDVTVATRVQRGHPGLTVDPEKLLQSVKRELGPCPKENPTAFCFWSAALINPLPSLGASMEIRGRILEAPNTMQRLQILEFGLRRSIDNLMGKRPL